MRMRATEAIDLEPMRDVGWKYIDSALQMISKRRGVLDAQEAKWLREALRVKIWREVGCVSMADYLERRLGYAPRTAHDRVRVAVALEELPQLAAELEKGLPHSAVRELTRVCTKENEQKWLDRTRGKSVHEIEELVSGRGRGSDPDDPAQPNLVGRTLPFEAIRPATEGLLRDARRRMQDERGGDEVLSDDEVLATLARAFLEGGTAERTKAPYQIAVTMCERCGCGWQDSGGRTFAMSKADVERACCDAERIGSIAGAPARATQDVPPSVRRLVHRRARGRCEVPGCRSARCLEIHHIIPRSLGGTHDVENLILSCDGCHAAHHRGLINIAGTASALLVKRKHEIHYSQPANDALDLSAVYEVAVSDAAPADDPTAHVGTNAGHLQTLFIANADDDGLDRDLVAGPNADRVDLDDPTAHVGTNAGHSDERVHGRTVDDGPTAHVGTNASSDQRAHDGRTVDDEPTAHVGTNAGHSDEGARGAARAIKTQIAVAAVAAHVGTPAISNFERERIRSQARMALVGLGYRIGVAGKAVDLVIHSHSTLEDVIRAALRSCACTT